MASIDIPRTVLPHLPASGLDSEAAIEWKLQCASDAFARYRRTPIADRAALLHCTAQILETEADRFAERITAEMGKPIGQARAETLKCAAVCRFYAENGEKMLRDEPSPSGYMSSFTRFQPLGTVLAIMPWNFPFWQVFRFAAPCLMAGNTVILKHASNVPRCSFLIEQIFHKAGFSRGIFQSIFANSSQIAGLIADSRIAAVTLTGSEAAGVSVGAAAGRAIKKVVLELGGSDPFIVMPSADLPSALATAVRSRMLNNGQSCIAAKRILLHDAIFAKALEQLARAVSALRVGDPFDESVDIGPLALEQFAVEMEQQVQRAKDAGATIVVGGRRSSAGSAHFEPTILTGLPRNSPVAREEFFGPVMVVDRFKTMNEAVEIANDSPFGLGASVWSGNEAEQMFFAENLEVGQVFVNAMTASDPRIPFGGIKRSGLGRELGIYGIREFTNIKSIAFG
jgi:succinate-semialdehyde dehydrogenase/glutarate-semialdehyde dehydrogenase